MQPITRYQYAISQFQHLSDRGVGDQPLPCGGYLLAGFITQPSTQKVLIMPTRYLKPGICDSEHINRCTPIVECLFYRLLVNVDDFGRLDARPAVIRAKCFPLKEITLDGIQEYLSELQQSGLIQLYESDCCVYLQMCKWDNIPRSRESKCPAPTDDRIQLHTSVNSSHTNLPVTVTVTVTDIPKPITGTATKELSTPLVQTDSKKGTRLPDDWVLPKMWGDWALSEKPHWTVIDVRRVADDFRDHWLSNANQAKSKKADWLATWRKWVRSSLNEKNPHRTNSVQDARLETARQIFGGANGTKRQVFDIDSIRTIEGGGEDFPETIPRIRESDAG